MMKRIATIADIEMILVALGINCIRAGRIDSANSPNLTPNSRANNLQKKQMNALQNIE